PPVREYPRRVSLQRPRSEQSLQDGRKAPRPVPKVERGKWPDARRPRHARRDFERAAAGGDQAPTHAPPELGPCPADPEKWAAHNPPGIAGAAGVLLARLTAGGAHAISGSRKTEAIKMSTMKEPSAMSATTEKKRPRSAVTSGRKLLIGGDPNS